MTLSSICDFEVIIPGKITVALLADFALFFLTESVRRPLSHSKLAFFQAILGECAFSKHRVAIHPVGWDSPGSTCCLCVIISRTISKSVSV